MRVHSVKTLTLSSTWHSINRLRKQRRVRNLGTLGLVLLGPVLALLTFTTISVFEQGPASQG